jgi:chitinase
LTNHCLPIAEHVFEGQIIGQFFSNWLAEGRLHEHEQLPARQIKMSCQAIDQFFLQASSQFPWMLNNQGTSFIYLMLAELGSVAHPDRLAVMKKRPNGMKGALFGGKSPTSLTVYERMGSDEQLSATKELGKQPFEALL